MGVVLLIVLLLLLIGAVPRWAHSRKWGYKPAVLLSAGLWVTIVLLVLGFIPSRL